MLNAFRLAILAVTVAVCWFAFFSNNGLRLSRRAPVQGSQEFCMTPGQVAVTFDEGPSQYTPAVLDGLASNNLKATFHVVTDYFANVAFITNMQTAYSQGHVIGLRVKQDTSKMTCDSIVSVLLTMSQQVHQIINVYPKFVRFNYGQYDASVVSCIAASGFVSTGWNVDSVDYTAGMSAQQTVAPYSEQFSQVGRGLGRYISLHHDIYPLYQDPSVISALANTLSSWGYNSVTLDACLNTAPYRSKNVPAANGPGSSAVAAPPSPPGSPIVANTKSSSSGFGIHSSWYVAILSVVAVLMISLA